MTIERIDIVLTDKVSPKPGEKLRQLAQNARDAYSAVERLQKEISQIDVSVLDRAATATARVHAGSKSDTGATARLNRERKLAETTSKKLALAEERLANEKAKVVSATRRAEEAQQAASRATAAAESASERLAQAKRVEEAAVESTASALNRSRRAMNRNTAATKLASHQIQNLIYQLNDIVVGLASGQKPMTVMLQQGSQISTIFGPGTGVLGILKAIGGFLGTLALKFLPLIAIAGGVITVFAALAKEIRGTTSVAVGMGDTFRAVTQLIKDGIISTLGPATSLIAPYFAAAYRRVLRDTKLTINAIISFFVSAADIVGLLWNKLPAAWAAVWKRAFNAILSVIEFGVNSVLSISMEMNNRITGSVIGSVAAITTAWERLPGAAVTAFRAAFNATLNIVQDSVQSVVRAVNSVFGYVDELTKTVLQIDLEMSSLIDPNKFDLGRFRTTVGEPIGQKMSESILTSFTDAIQRDYSGGLLEAIDLSQYRQGLSESASDTASEISSAINSAFSQDYLGNAFNAVRTRAIEIARNRILDTAARSKEVLEEILAPIKEYRKDSRALNQLLEKGLITVGQVHERMARLKVVSNLNDLDKSLGVTQFAFAAVAKEIRNVEQQRINAVKQALEVSIISEQDAADRIVGIHRQAALDIARARRDSAVSLRELDASLEHTRFQLEAEIQGVRIAEQEKVDIVQEYLDRRIITEQDAMSRVVAIQRQAGLDIMQLQKRAGVAITTSSKEIFGSLADSARNLAGEQSAAYRVLFAASKAFAIAESLIKIQQGIAQALSLPFPVNIGAIATVAALGASIIANLTAVAGTGFRQGGYTGSGSAAQPAGVVHKGEFVFDAAATSRVGVAALEGIRKGGIPLTAPQVANAGGGGGSNINVFIENHGTDKDFEVRPVNRTDVVVIARDVAREVVREDGPFVIASDISDANSRVSRSLAQNTSMQRRR